MRRVIYAILLLVAALVMGGVLASWGVLVLAKGRDDEPLGALLLFCGGWALWALGKQGIAMLTNRNRP